ncbi:LIM-domain binding protein-domain-containing protein [Syncephalis pseudoplumigaleata]|uniref:LIM-domain binding protein-domain-containing protein n=1 Tax=Syncephalis pseudoplumigaleata TaxID=1712513 RepID=A0A4V1J0W6_9FUNG|nr:LIM-domain binding protein-domain-containing protein [Syncephalis pseudoplumigaleata]|eukprot:RKP22989.1 LIM-domain binding protein-domain-containing protein [Syncephalis pseudoplumigaleata]
MACCADLKSKAIAHFYHTNFCCGVQSIQFSVEQIKEFAMANGCLVADCPRVSLYYLFEDGSKGMKIEGLEFDTQQHVELVPRSILQQVSDAATAAAKQPRRKKADQSPLNGDKTAATSVPASLVNEFGIVPDAMQVLEMSDTFHQMSDLFQLSALGGNQSLPIDVMKQYCSLAAEMQQQMATISANTNTANNNNSNNNNGNNGNNVTGNLNDFGSTSNANTAMVPSAPEPASAPLSATPNNYAADINQLLASTMPLTPQQQQALLASVTGMGGAVQPSLNAANHAMMVGVKNELSSHTGMELLQSPVLGGMLSPTISGEPDPIGGAGGAGASGSPKSAQATTTGTASSASKKRNRNSTAAPRPRKKTGSTSKAAAAAAANGGASATSNGATGTATSATAGTETAAHAGHHPALLTGNP